MKDERTARAIMLEAGCFRLGRQLRIDPDALRAWLEEHRVSAHATPSAKPIETRRRVARQEISLEGSWWEIGVER